MIGVGLLAMRMGGKALWALPLSFMGLMVAGGVAGMDLGGTATSFVEPAVACSVIAMAAAILVGPQLNLKVAAALVGGIAVFHGYAHGTEMPPAGSTAMYALGFVVATGMLHLAGIAIGLGAGRAGRVSYAYTKSIRAKGFSSRFQSILCILKSVPKSTASWLSSSCSFRLALGDGYARAVDQAVDMIERDDRYRREQHEGGKGRGCGKANPAAEWLAGKPPVISGSVGGIPWVHVRSHPRRSMHLSHRYWQ